MGTYTAIVAIDFGTTFSGYAFSVSARGSNNDTRVFTNKTWPLAGPTAITLKTPTTLLLEPDGRTLHSFGYEAETNYCKEIGKEKTKRYWYFEKFKMVLHSKQRINEETMIQAANGNSFRAMIVFSKSLEYLKNHAIESLRKHTGDPRLSDKHIQWVVTVPAIWSPQAKQFMRKAVYEAGMASADNPSQLLIALEPECAAIFCKARNLDDPPSTTFKQPNDLFMVIDIGGGTLDVTAYEKLGSETVKEIHKASGGPFGGMKVNKEFEKLLTELFGDFELHKYRKENCGDWLRVMNAFEIKKREDRFTNNKDTQVELPNSFLEYFCRPLSDNFRRQVISRYGTSDAVTIWENTHLCLKSKVMQKLFSPVVEDIKSHLRKLLSSPLLCKVKTLLVVGGFAESTFLQQQIRSTFPDPEYRVVIPKDGSTAVMQGAVYFGNNPRQINARVVATTYGVSTSPRFIPGVHPEEKKVHVDNLPHCKDVFSLLVKDEETIMVGQEITKTYNPIKANQTSASFPLYSSRCMDVKYVTDVGVRKIGEIVVDSPNTSQGTDRELKLTLNFGDTEIKVTAFDVSSGNQKTTNIDFFYR